MKGEYNPGMVKERLRKEEIASHRISDRIVRNRAEFIDFAVIVQELQKISPVCYMDVQTLWCEGGMVK